LSIVEHALDPRTLMNTSSQRLSFGTRGSRLTTFYFLYVAKLRLWFISGYAGTSRRHGALRGHDMSLFRLVYASTSLLTSTAPRLDGSDPETRL